MSESGKPDFSGVDYIVKSMWTGDYFIYPPLPDGTFMVCDSYEPDAELHDYITDMVESWRGTSDDDNGYWEYTQGKSMVVTK